MRQRLPLEPSTFDAGALNHGTIEVPNFDDPDGYYNTSPVGAFPSGAAPNGALDMFGNAWEWTADFRVRQWDLVLGEREGQVIIDPHTAAIGFYAAVRGGSRSIRVSGNASFSRIKARCGMFEFADMILLKAFSRRFN